MLDEVRAKRAGLTIRCLRALVIAFLMKPMYSATVAIAINGQTPAERANRRRHNALLARDLNRWRLRLTLRRPMGHQDRRDA
jgi:hypothetical protein